MKMKHLKTISSGIQSVAKLTLLLLFLACTAGAADMTSPFASIVGVWPTHFANGISRVYRIREDGTVSYDQGEPLESKSSKLTVINGEIVADFGDRFMGFYKTSDDQMNVAIFSSKATLKEHNPSVTGKGYRAVASNSNDPIIGMWKWFTDPQRNFGGVAEVKTDGTFTMVGTSRIGTWKSTGDRNYVLNWFTLGSEDTLKLSTEGNGLEGKNQHGTPIFGERMQTVAAKTNTPAPPSSVPSVAMPVLHSIEEVLAVADTSKPLKPFDVVDFTAVQQVEKSLAVLKGREIEIEFLPQEPTVRVSETKLRWQLATVKAGGNMFTPVMTVYLPAELVPTALEIGPGKAATVRGTLRGFSVTYGSGPMLYFALDVTSLTGKSPAPAPLASPVNVQHTPPPAGVTLLTPVQAKPTASASPAVPNQSTKTISLKTGWDGPIQGGSKSLEDLAFVLNGFAKADANPPFEDVEIYNGVKYLMPLNEAVAALGIKGRLPAMKKVVAPGFPRESLNYTSVDGLFEGHYNRMDIVTDLANQVVTIQFVDEHPKDTSYISYLLKGNWLTYNFVGYRVKALTTLSVDYSLEAYDSRQSRWWREKPEYLAKYYPTTPALRIFTYLMDRHQIGKPDKRLEETMWCVPRPFASLLLHCVSKGSR